MGDEIGLQNRIRGLRIRGVHYVPGFVPGFMLVVYGIFGRNAKKRFRDDEDIAFYTVFFSAPERALGFRGGLLSRGVLTRGVDT